MATLYIRRRPSSLLLLLLLLFALLSCAETRTVADERRCFTSYAPDLLLHIIIVARQIGLICSRVIRQLCRSFGRLLSAFRAASYKFRQIYFKFKASRFHMKTNRGFMGGQKSHVSLGGNQFSPRLGWFVRRREKEEEEENVFIDSRFGHAYAAS